MTYTFADCLGFAGGFTLGMVQAGFELVAKRELPGGFGVANCEVNRALLGDRWQTQIGVGESWEPVTADVVVGNPPCSGFSVMTDKRWRGVDAKVNACMWSFSNYVAAVRPQIAVMESVRVAYKTGRPLMQQLRANVEAKTGLRYDVWHVYQNALELGGAAVRPRYFFVMSQVPFGVEYPRVHTPNVRDVFGDLDGLESTWELQPYRRPSSWWSKDARSDTGVVDGHVGLKSPYVTRGLALLEAAGDWPQGWPIAKVLKHYYDTHDSTLPPIWMYMLPKLIAKDWFMGFTTMVRWPENRPGRVITGAAMNSVLHPWLPRPITHRECARVMGFPDDWRILPLRGASGLSQTWGKGITVQCGKWIGDWVRRALDGVPGGITGQEVGDREFFVDSAQQTRVTPANIAR